MPGAARRRAWPRPLVRAVQSTGGQVELCATPRRIVIENGRAVGVETTDGRLFKARHFVALGGSRSTRSKPSST